MKKYSKQDHKLFVIWAVSCAKRVLPYFEKDFPKDARPRNALETANKYVRTGIFKMKEIRKASLDSHASARKVKNKNIKACFAARCAGQAVATCHVPQHAFGACYYALKIASLKNSKTAMEKEIIWQTNHLPKPLRKDWKNWYSKSLPRDLRKLIPQYLLTKKKN